MPRPLNRPQGPGAALIWDMLTFERLMTNTVVHLIYWAGLAIIAVGVFGFIGAAVGVALRDPFPWGLLMAIPVVVGMARSKVLLPSKSPLGIGLTNP